MNVMRRWVVGFLGLVLFISLLGSAYSISFNRTFGSAEKVQTLLAESKVYDHLTNSILLKSEDEAQQGVGDISIPYTDEAVKQAATQSFTPEILENSVNTFIDANFAWLSGKAEQPSFLIDLTNAKQDFAQRVGQQVTERLEALPVCTAEDQAKLQIPIDPLTVTCRPSNLDPQAEGNRVTQEISSGNFLSNSVLEPNTLGKDKESQEEPYYKRLSFAPTLFQLAQKAAWILGLLAILCAAGIFFMSADRRRGLRKIGIILLVAGVLLIGTKILADIAVDRIESKPVLSSGSVTNELSQTRQSVLKKVESQLTQTNMLFGIIFTVLGAGILIYLVTSKGQGKPSKRLPDSMAPIAEQSSPKDEEYVPPRPTPAGPTLDESAGDRLRQAHSGPQPGAPTLPQRPQESQAPRKRKPPRLIQ